MGLEYTGVLRQNGLKHLLTLNKSPQRETDEEPQKFFCTERGRGTHSHTRVGGWEAKLERKGPEQSLHELKKGEAISAN